MPSISWNVNACTPSFAYASKQYLTSAATSSRPLSGGTLCHLTPCRSLNVHVRWSELGCQDSARSPLSVKSVVPVASSGNAYRTRRLLVSPANWNSPIDCVSRGSITGGSQAVVRGDVPPRFGGFVLAGIQSGYFDGVAACALREPAATVMATPHPTRVRNSRRSTVDIS